MFKGIQKNVIFIQLPKSKYFESAYFILRSQEISKESAVSDEYGMNSWGRSRYRTNEDMVKEANRIVFEMEPQKKRNGIKKGKTGGGKFLFFLYGLLAGAFGVAVTWLITLIVS